MLQNISKTKTASVFLFFLLADHPHSSEWGCLQYQTWPVDKSVAVSRKKMIHFSYCGQCLSYFEVSGYPSFILEKLTH